VFIDRSTRTSALCAVPTLVAVRPHTVTLFPQLAAGVAAPAFRSPGTMTLAELARRLGTGVAEAAPLQRVLFVTLSPATEGCIIAPMLPSDARAAVAKAGYGAQRPAGERTIFETLYDRSGDGEPASGHRLDDGMPASRCLLGPGAYERSAAEWLQQAVGARTVSGAGL
jgi:hypothetical protein